MVGLNYQEMKDLLIKHKIRHYKLYRESNHHHEKSYHFGAWKAIKDLEVEFTQEIKKKAGL